MDKNINETQEQCTIHSVISRFIFDEAKKHGKQINEIVIYIDACHKSDEFVDIVVCEDDYTELSRYKSLNGL